MTTYRAPCGVVVEKRWADGGHLCGHARERHVDGVCLDCREAGLPDRYVRIVAGAEHAFSEHAPPAPRRSRRVDYT